jgi:hypothetical protein
VGKLPIFLQGSKVEGLPWAKLFSRRLAWPGAKKLFIKTHFDTARDYIYNCLFSQDDEKLKTVTKVDRKSFTIEKRTVLSTLRRYSHTNLKMRAVF